MRADDSFRLESAGARYGFPLGGGSSGFQQAEAYATCTLPFDLQLSARWRLEPRIEFSAGWLGGWGDDTALATLGGTLVFVRESFPMSLEVGFRPTFIGREEFGNHKDFGSSLQFTTHAGVNLDLGRSVRFGYRIQHMSNAHLDEDNPGLDLHMLCLSWRF